METFNDIYSYVKARLMDSSQYGGPWFHSEEEFENWAGDVLMDAVKYTLKAVGISVSPNDDNTLIGKEIDEEPTFDLDMGFDPYMGCYTDDC